ncbi:hypothetical protein [Ammoniphilus sp. 3BR4]|uniref:hypothetical protein n=1 Tax=Ammoniphilus sp. 3BR4 TaxID=3158265 RepID=UPI0034671FBC
MKFSETYRNLFNVDLSGYQKYEYEQLLSQAEQKKLKQLAKFNEDIVIKELNKDIKPPYKNVADPFTFVKEDKAYIVFKKADGTNVLYTMRKENDTWINVKRESQQGKVMPKELLRYMFKPMN